MVTSHGLLTNERRIKVLNFTMKCPHCWLMNSARGRKNKTGGGKMKIWGFGGLNSENLHPKLECEERETAPVSWGRGSTRAGAEAARELGQGASRKQMY